MLETLSDHIRAVRMDRGLLQREVADIIGVAFSSIENWERKRNEVSLKYIPNVLAFLGDSFVR